MTRVSAMAGEQADSAPAHAPSHGDQLLTTAQVATRLQISIPLVRKAIRDGRLKASLPGGRKHGYRIAPTAVEDWLTSSSVVPRPPA